MKTIEQRNEDARLFRGLGLLERAEMEMAKFFIDEHLRSAGPAELTDDFRAIRGKILILANLKSQKSNNRF